MAYTEAAKQSMLRYQKKAIKQEKFNFNVKYDADILAKLDSVPNKLGYIKDLIRADIARENQSKTPDPAQNDEMN